MDKIWDRKSFSGRLLAVVAAMKKNEWPRRTDKRLNTKKTLLMY